MCTKFGMKIVGIQKMYKIRRKIDQRYSTGGSPPSWSKKGKLWVSRHALHCHLTLLGTVEIATNYRDCEIVEYEVTEKAVEPVL